MFPSFSLSPVIRDFKTACCFGVQISMITPKDFVGPLMELAQNRRGEFTEMKYITEARCELVYELPLGEVSGPPFALRFGTYFFPFHHSVSSFLRQNLSLSFILQSRPPSTFCAFFTVSSLPPLAFVAMPLYPFDHLRFEHLLLSGDWPTGCAWATSAAPLLVDWFHVCVCCLLVAFFAYGSSFSFVDTVWIRMLSARFHTLQPLQKVIWPLSLVRIFELRVFPFSDLRGLN